MTTLSCYSIDTYNATLGTANLQQLVTSSGVQRYCHFCFSTYVNISAASVANAHLGLILVPSGSGTPTVTGTTGGGGWSTNVGYFCFNFVGLAAGETISTSNAQPNGRCDLLIPANTVLYSAVGSNAGSTNQVLFYYNFVLHQNGVNTYASNLSLPSNSGNAPFLTDTSGLLQVDLANVAGNSLSSVNLPINLAQIDNTNLASSTLPVNVLDSTLTNKLAIDANGFITTKLADSSTTHLVGVNSHGDLQVNIVDAAGSNIAAVSSSGVLSTTGGGGGGGNVNLTQIAGVNVRASAGALVVLPTTV